MKKPNNPIQFDPDEYNIIEARVRSATVTPRATAVVVDCTINGRVFSVYGEARRDPHDHHDSDVALSLALGRAFGQLARRFDRLAQGRIHHHDQMRAQRQAQLALRRAQLRQGQLAAVAKKRAAQTAAAPVKKAVAKKVPARKRAAVKKLAPTRKVAAKRVAKKLTPAQKAWRTRRRNARA